MGIEIKEKHPLDNDGILVRLTGEHQVGSWPDGKMSSWLKENCVGEWKFCITTIWFEKEEDAIAFKIRWI